MSANRRVEPTTIAFDPGFGGVKVYGPEGGMVLQSAVASNGAKTVAKVEGLKAARKPMIVETLAGTFYIGSGAHDAGRPVENLDFDRLTGSPEMLALFLGAMACYGVSGETNLIVGLPIAALMGDEAGETQRAVRKFLTGEHTWLLDGKQHTLTVSTVQITSQPVGAMFDFLLTDEGQMNGSKKAVFKKEIGILGIGMNTVDLLVVRGGAPVQRFTTGETAGVRRLLELLNHNGMFSLAELDDQLRAGVLDLEIALPVWQREVLGLVEKQWSKAFRRFAVTVIVGGGAHLLRDALQRRFGGRAFVPDDPVLATARGLYKYVVMKNRKSKD